MQLIGYEHDGIKLKGFPLFLMAELLPHVLVWLGQLIKVCSMCIVQEYRLCNCFNFSMQSAILMYECVFVVGQVWGAEGMGSVERVGRRCEGECRWGWERMKGRKGKGLGEDESGGGEGVGK